MFPSDELLGGKVNDSIRCYASQLQFGWNEDVGPRGTAKEYADICKYAMSEGYDAVKLDFTMYDRDKKDIPNRDCEGFISNDFYKMVEERIAAIREECGDVDIIMENHGRTDVTSAIKLGELCDKYNFYALEEPATPLRPEFQKLMPRKGAHASRGRRASLYALAVPELLQRQLHPACAAGCLQQLRRHFRMQENLHHGGGL